MIGFAWWPGHLWMFWLGLPPCAAYSHFASVGNLFPSQLAYAVASSQVLPAYWMVIGSS